MEVVIVAEVEVGWVVGDTVVVAVVVAVDAHFSANFAFLFGS